MQINFTDSAPENIRLSVQIVNQGDPLDAFDEVLAQGAPAARFMGKAGQVFEGFVRIEGELRRLAISGAGEKDAANASSISSERARR